MFDQDAQLFAQMAIAMLLSLSFHELAHARTALAFGDTTARDEGRVTLNPLAHLDPIGSVLFLLAGGLGWAKPVPVNPANLEPRRLGDFMVSLAGPMANLALAIFAALLYRALRHLPVWAVDYPFLQSTVDFLATRPYVLSFVSILVWVNLGLMFFNLIPLYPLDGHHLQRELLPLHAQGPYMDFQVTYGKYILIGLMTLCWFGGQISPNMPNPLMWVLTFLRDPTYNWLLRA